MAFSLKSLFKGGKKSAVPALADDDDPFMQSPEEIPESEALKIERSHAAKKSKKSRKKKGFLSALTDKLGRKGKKGKQSSTADADPFNNPELMALIASEVAAIPMPEEIAEADPEPEVVKPAPQETPPPSVAPAADVDDEMLDDEPPVEEDLPAFMSKPERDYEGMPDFAMPEQSKAMGYGDDDDEDSFGKGFPIGGMDDDDRAGAGGMSKGRLGAIAAGILALALAGGGAYWMFGAGPSGGETMAEGSDSSQSADAQDEKGGGLALPRALPGDRISMSMPPAPTAMALADPAAERSTSRRPWLSEGATPLGPQASEPTAPVGNAAVAQATPPADAPATSDPSAAPPNTPEDKAAHGPSDGLDSHAQTMAVEPASDKTSPAATGSAMAESTPPVTPTSPVAPAKGTGNPAQMALAALPALTVPSQPDAPDGKVAIPSYDKLPTPKTPAKGLTPAPDTALARQTPMGLLPVRASDGRTAWQTYARPFAGDPNKPRIALVVIGLGLDPQATAAAITALPPDVTLAFSPYAPNLANQMAAARAAGHEVLLDLPMEPSEFPSRDPGPLAMLTMQGPSDNVSRLEMVLGKGTGFTGVVNRMGSKFTASPDAMRPVLEALGQRGLLYVNNSPNAAGLAANVDIALPMAESLFTVDQNPFRAAIDSRLKYLVEAAKARGRVVALVSPTPLSFSRVIDWSQNLATSGVQLAPVSAAVSGAKS